MPIWYDDDFDWGEWERDAIESIHVEFDSDGNVDLYVESDGEMEFVGSFNPDEAQDYIWDDLWYWAEENDVDFDKDTEYADA